MSDAKEKSEKRYKVIPIVISLVILTIASINLYLAIPTPNLEIGMFPRKESWLSNSVIFTPIKNDSTGRNYFNVTYDYSTQCSLYNFTFQIYNTGRGVARNVNIRIRGEPESNYTVNSTQVFVGEPLKSNLLDVGSQDYSIGLLGSGKSYSFMFIVRVQGGSEAGKFVVKVTSDNAGTHTYNLLFEKSNP